MEQKTTPVLVMLSSHARGEKGEIESPIRLMCRGKLRESANGCMLRYEEVQTDDETGMSVKQDVILNLQPGRVTMTRLGPFGTTMVFVKDRRFEGAYHTPYGDLELALFATRVDVKLAEDHGSVHLEYQLDMQGNYAAVQVIDVSWCAESSRP